MHWSRRLRSPCAQHLGLQFASRGGMTSMQTTASPVLAPDYAPIARHARRLAQKAGEQLRLALGAPRKVRWKVEAHQHSAVSDLDDAIERMLRASIRTVFPTHAIVGEEHEDAPATGSPFTWVIDPIDGTTNFTNGVPLYAASIGVLRGGEPIAGAIWCASTHRLQAGVYHAMHGGPFCLDDEPLVPLPRHALRGVVSEPGGHARLSDIGDQRVLGSAATECAWAAVGVLRAALLERPRVWDVAAGIALARAARCEVYTLDEDAPRSTHAYPNDARRSFHEQHWQSFRGFPAHTADHLRQWSRPLLIGRVGTVLAPAPKLQS